MSSTCWRGTRHLNPALTFDTGHPWGGCAAQIASIATFLASAVPWSAPVSAVVPAL
ncbi:e4b72485-b52f-4ae6-bc16-b4b67f58cdec [Thermothielavioides terrestris]|uniref:E4b72485-b52f-4ae6-bc16-b4b67f58cdec n=1 Tax=Thermothielavioides terrestris TaxID=2587410 RepID=A0A446BID8_9PEZI|nr:e4b72485-b52f-4ae6-bc16-b4b67f58cdec [Thermothielavioides terrestris]